MSRRDSPYVGRGGEKLAAALDAFRIDPAGRVCADFGANVGGFTDCLLRRGTARVYAVDTGYGALAWTLRKDPRVVVMERTNALHCEAPEPVDLLAVDVAWTPQARIIPAAVRWLGPGGRIVSLLKCHYERAKLSGRRGGPPLTDAEAEAICRTVCERLGDAGAPVRAAMRSPLRGKGGGAEFLLLITPGGVLS
ncbi:MAG: TlyA family RNA methyltransferase [Phycisphaerae bacterium]|nr:TlyA family RNA methyltransferase [Phycisphaerae bacterium]